MQEIMGKLVEALRAIGRIACGEDQVDEDDWQALARISKMADAALAHALVKPSDSSPCHSYAIMHDGREYHPSNGARNCNCPNCVAGRKQERIVRAAIRKAL